MNEIDIYEKMGAIADPLEVNIDELEGSKRYRMLVAHKNWLSQIRHEKPSTARHFRVAVYIRFYNQTKYENYLDHHKAQFLDALSLCPNWEFVGFYIDEGQTAPNMETAPEWRRLLDHTVLEAIQHIRPVHYSLKAAVPPFGAAYCKSVELPDHTVVIFTFDRQCHGHAPILRELVVVQYNFYSYHSYPKL